MGRMARVVVPEYPHHITQRGNRRQKTFFNDSDYAAYLDLMAQWYQKHHVQVWAYCLMPNHVHLIAAPQTSEGFQRAIGEAHRRYTRMINFREGWRGHLWQGRFASYPMNERYLRAAARYVEWNPVRAGLSQRPEEYRWSSAQAHLSGRDNILVKAQPLLDIIGDWREYLYAKEDDPLVKKLRAHERTGRPLGDDSFMDKLENLLGRSLRKQKPGPKLGEKTL